MSFPDCGGVLLTDAQPVHGLECANRALDLLSVRPFNTIENRGFQTLKSVILVDVLCLSREHVVIHPESLENVR